MVVSMKLQVIFEIIFFVLQFQFERPKIRGSLIGELGSRDSAYY